MLKVKLVFRSGAVVDLEVNDFKVTRGSRGVITAVEWVSGKDNPLVIEPRELVAVIERMK